MAHKEFALTIVYEGYVRNGGTKTYSGKDEVTVLQKIAERHMYGYVMKEVEIIENGETFCDESDEKETDAKKVWRSIRSMNGDGCDYISAFFVGSHHRYKGPK